MEVQTKNEVTDWTRLWHVNVLNLFSEQDSENRLGAMPLQTVLGRSAKSYILV